MLTCRMGSTGSLNLAPTICPWEIANLQSFTPNWQSLVETHNVIMGTVLVLCLRMNHNPHCTCCLNQNPRDKCFTLAQRVFGLSSKQTSTKCSLIVTHADTNSPSLSSLGNNSLQKPKWLLFKLHFLFGTFQALEETFKLGKLRNTPIQIPGLQRNGSSATRMQ